MSELLEQLKNYLESDDGRAHVLEAQAKYLFRQKMMDKYMYYLHSLSAEERSKLFAKIKKKYDSDEYYTRWIKRYIEPENKLYSYILEYGYRYGVENVIHDSYFGYDSYIIDNNWIITAWYGQGTAYDLIKLTK